MFAKSLVNPYEPTLAPIERQDRTLHESFLVPYRVDWLVLAAIVVSFLDSITICVFHTSRTGVITDPILAPLANHSLAWIPVYRLAVPLLIPIMPNVCRQSFAVFYLFVGLLFGINNLSGHYLGRFVFVDSIGLYPTVGICFLFASLAFCVRLASSRNTAQSFGNTAAWLVLAVMLQGIFFAVGRFV